MRHIPEVQCEAEVNPCPTGDDPMPWLTCLNDKGHPGKIHRTICNTFCETCGGVDHHFEGCADMESSAKPEYMVIEFDDTGTYWCAKVF